MYDHGNYDYDHGCILPEGVKRYERWNSNPTRRQEIHELWKKVNGDRIYGSHKQILPYSCYDRKNWGTSRWAHDRKQNTSSVARRRYKSTCNKHTRQLLKQEMLNDVYDDYRCDN